MPVTNFHCFGTSHVRPRRALFAFSSLIALMTSAPAFAQSEAADGVVTTTQAQSGLTDIVVTASRRSTNVQDVAISVSAVGGSQLTTMGITDSAELARVVPNIVASTGYAGGNLHFGIRGLSSTDFATASSSPVAIYLDDVYQAYSFGITSQLTDLDRVEVLRGPQGTLFGKNTTGGAVNYFSATPVNRLASALNLDVSAGEYGRYNVDGMVNVPLVDDTLALRANASFDHRDSYLDNLAGGRSRGKYTRYSGRLQLRWTPSTETTVNLKLHGMKNEGDSTLYHGGFIVNVCAPENFDPLSTPYANCNGNSLPADALKSSSVRDEVSGFEDYHNYGATLRVDQELGQSSLTSISAYQKVVYDLLTNDDGNSTDFFHSRQPMTAWQASQEIRLATPAEKPLSAILGLFVQKDVADSRNSSQSTFFGPPLDFVAMAVSKQKTTTLAAFGSATYNFSEQFSITAGLRYSREKKTVDLDGLNLFSGAYDLTDDLLNQLDLNALPFVLDPLYDVTFNQNEKRSWSRVTWDITASYKPNDDILIYAKASEGFRSGGYNLFATFPGSVSTVDPEIVRAYELGLKTDLFDRLLRINAAAFYNDFSDQQILTLTGSSAEVRFSNAGASTIKGFELEIEAAPARGLRLQGAVGYTDAKYDRFDTLIGGAPGSLAGNRLPYAPKWTASALWSYQADLGDDYSLTISNDWSFRSKIFFDPYNQSVTGDGSVLMGNVNITLEHGSNSDAKQSLSFYVKNLTDRSYKTWGFSIGDQWYSQVYGDGIQFGAKLGFQF